MSTAMYDALFDMGAARDSHPAKTLEEQLTDAYAEGRKDQAEEDRHEIERLKDQVMVEQAAYEQGVKDERDRITFQIRAFANKTALGLA